MTIVGSHHNQGLRDKHNAGPQERGPRGGTFYHNAQGNIRYGIAPPPYVPPVTSVATSAARVAQNAAAQRGGQIPSSGGGAAPKAVVPKAAPPQASPSHAAVPPTTSSVKAPEHFHVAQAAARLHSGAKSEQDEKAVFNAWKQDKTAHAEAKAGNHIGGKEAQDRAAAAGKGLPAYKEHMKNVHDAHMKEKMAEQAPKAAPAPPAPARPSLAERMAQFDAKEAQRKAEIEARHAEFVHPAPINKTPQEQASHEKNVVKNFHGPKEDEKLVREHLASMRLVQPALQFTPVTDVAMGDKIPEGSYIKPIEPGNGAHQHAGFNKYNEMSKSAIVVDPNIRLGSTDVRATKAEVDKNLRDNWGKHPIAPVHTGAATQREHDIKAALSHEVGHHVQKIGDPNEDIIKAAYNAHDANGVPLRNAVSKYATSSTVYKSGHEEYFAECFSVFQHHPDALYAHDPIGYKMVNDVIAKANVEAVRLKRNGMWGSE